MDEYDKLIIRKATVSDVDRIMNIIQDRCKWLDSKNIEQWNVTRTYKKDYYLKKLEDELFYVAIYYEKIVRNIYDKVL